MAARRRSGRGPSSLSAAVVVLVVGAAVIVGVWWGRRSPPEADRPAGASAPGAASPVAGPRERRDEQPARGDAQTAAPAAAEEGAVVLEGGPVGRLALVVDDLGRSLEEAARVAGLGVPVAAAVLPYEPRSREVALRLAEGGVEILCHLPMEPGADADPGPGALLRSMGEEELVAVARRALEAVPGAVGVNNHMGSAFTSDAAAMRTLLRFLRRRGLFFLDSRTGPGTVGYATARALGVPAVERDVFLDPDLEAATVRHEWDRLLEVAAARGAAVGLAHPRAVTFEVLREEIPLARERGFEFVPVSYLLDRADSPAP